MPEGQDVVLNTGQQAIINTDTSNVFLWNRRSEKGQINNSTYSDITYPVGTVMGRVSATGLLKPFTSGASDGSQYPIGILCNTYVVEDSSTSYVYICDDGDVAAEKLLFQGSDTLETVVSGQRVKDRLKAAGVKVIYSTEMTGYDNQ